eukprot:gb/GECG01016591.1/.p1 GENE.gb/GECG01016591.1/~~gb/GECG01016591.1/.p1  ORF type:complete len:475 (+),score=56.37 gb/GECG01016591.1/:1-1425(+)
MSSSATSDNHENGEEDEEDKKLPAVLYRASFHNAVWDVMRKKAGWKETTSNVDWDFNWADVGWIREHFDNIHMEEHQKVNHFRNHYELTRKDLLVKNIKRMKKQLEKSESKDEANKYDFLPESYVLPGEYGLFVEAFKRRPGATWIMKPIGKAQGRGIFLFNKLSQISDWKKDHNWNADAPQAETYVAQRYIANPYTIGGKKFDIRLYALVTSFSPLTIWLYRSGFARFSFTRYSRDKADQNNLWMHLTNVSIQKKAEEYDSARGCKMFVRELKLFLASKHGMPAVETLFAETQALIIRTLLSVQKVIIQDKHSFELYGFDVLFDTSLKPWLLEVNASPSLSADTDTDYQLKYGLIEDTLDVVDVESHRSGKEKRVGGYDLIWENGPVETDLPSTTSTGLGCYNSTLENVIKRKIRKPRKKKDDNSASNVRPDSPNPDILLPIPASQDSSNAPPANSDHGYLWTPESQRHIPRP